MSARLSSAYRQPRRRNWHEGRLEVEDRHERDETTARVRIVTCGERLDFVRLRSRVLRDELGIVKQPRAHAELLVTRCAPAHDSSR